MKNPINKKLNIIIALLVILTAAAIAGLVWVATPFNSPLAWKIYDWLHDKKVSYTHNNIYTDGVQGILEDIGTRLDLPETLYIRNAQTIGYDVNGTVTDIYMLLYGVKDNGDVGTYLVSYNADSSANRRAHDKDGSGGHLTVTVGGSVSTDFSRDTMLLQPMLDLADALDLQELSEWYAAISDSDSLEIIYWGYRQMDTNAYSYRVTPTSNQLSAIVSNTYDGYEISLHAPDNSDAAPARYFADHDWLSAADYVDPVTAEEERQENATEAMRTNESMHGTSYLLDDGHMYCYVTNEIGYRLIVADAAAGSRFYQLEKTTDGGTTWTLWNEDPFLGIIGVVGGMQFEDELHGKIWIDSPSGGTKETCRTEDGGVTFTAVVDTELMAQ